MERERGLGIRASGGRLAGSDCFRGAVLHRRLAQPLPRWWKVGMTPRCSCMGCRKPPRSLGAPQGSPPRCPPH